MGKWYLPDGYWFKLGTSAGSEATQQMSLDILSLAATQWVLTHLCVQVKFQSHEGEVSTVYQAQTDQNLAM